MKSYIVTPEDPFLPDIKIHNAKLYRYDGVRDSKSEKLTSFPLQCDFCGDNVSLSTGENK